MRQLDEQLKFETYRQWRQYIGSKYIDYSRDKLNEFSRYLNQIIRNKRPFDKALNILSTALITLICTELFNVFLSTFEELNEKFVWLILCMLLVFFAACYIVKFINPIFDNHFERNFLADYKEIIDDIISEKGEEKDHIIEK